MGFESENLRRLGNTINVPIKADENGYLGRECPVDECLGYFKITPGTGVSGPAPCHCPYCGHVGESNTFFTREQIEYARSVALRKITNAIHQDLKSLEFESKPKGLFGIGFSLKVKAGAPVPIRYYRERQLETQIVCDNCSLRYAIYGVFGWCPDCGVHNSVQILEKNLELAKKELMLAKATEDEEMADHLIGDALENVVSSFDGFGREICRRKGTEVRFQNLLGAQKRIKELFGFDFASGLGSDELELACKLFQKRHLLAHKMGVIDDDYVAKVTDPNAILGRKIRVTYEEVEIAIRLVQTLSKRLYSEILGASS